MGSYKEHTGRWSSDEIGMEDTGIIEEFVLRGAECKGQNAGNTPPYLVLQTWTLAEAAMDYNTQTATGPDSCNMPAV